MKRYECLKALASTLADDIIVVGNVGNTSTMLSELRPSEANLYQVNLGSCTALGLGLALALPHRKILVLDGDGSILLNLAVLADVANQGPANLRVIVFDNQSYESGGDLPTATAGLADLAEVARAAGIKNAWTVRNIAEFEEGVKAVLGASELTLVVAKIDRGDPPYVPRPHLTLDGRENKYRFIRYVERSEGRRIFPGVRGSRMEIIE